MLTVTIDQIDERLTKLPPEKLVVVYDFVSYLLERAVATNVFNPTSETLQTMIASETVLGWDWNRPEEDAAWADL